MYTNVGDVGRLGRRYSNSTPPGVYSANETTPTSTRALGLLSWHGCCSTKILTRHTRLPPSTPISPCLAPLARRLSSRTTYSSSWSSLIIRYYLIIIHRLPSIHGLLVYTKPRDFTRGGDKGICPGPLRAKKKKNL